MDARLRRHDDFGGWYYPPNAIGILCGTDKSLLSQD